MIIPMTVAEIANATNPVAAKLRRANRCRSAMGADAMRSSYITKAANATAAAASRATIAGLAQPSALPRISATISAVSAPVIRAVPTQSARPPAGSRDSRSRATPAASAATPIGRLTKKMDRQPRVSVSTPPASGPTALAAPSVAPNAPSARARAAPENSARSSGVAVANSTAPPAPCNARNNSSASAVGASAHASDPAVKMPRPAQPVTQGGRRQQQHRQHQGIGGTHPLQVRQARPQIPLNRRQRDAHYGDIQQQHERRRAHQHQRPPLPRRRPRYFSHLPHHPKRRPLS